VLEESEPWLLSYGSVMSDTELSDRLSDLKQRFSEDHVLARAMEPSEPGELQYARALLSTDAQIEGKQSEYDSTLAELRPMVHGKLCPIGDTTTGSTDLKRTPADPAMPGVVVNAAAISSMLSGTKLVVYAKTISSAIES
jgi:CHASE2 domain